jgi:hypothetical protein
MRRNYLIPKKNISELINTSRQKNADAIEVDPLPTDLDQSVAQRRTRREICMPTKYDTFTWTEEGTGENETVQVYSAELNEHEPIEPKNV